MAIKSCFTKLYVRSAFLFIFQKSLRVGDTRLDLNTNFFYKIKQIFLMEGKNINSNILHCKVDFCSHRYRGKDKSDRATAEQVMDPRTRMILFKMLSRGVITEINGCISTGKEANVYHATAKDGSDRAVKVYIRALIFLKKNQCCTCSLIYLNQP